MPANPLQGRISLRARKGTCVAIGFGKQMAAQYTSDGSYHMYFGLRLPEHWSQDRSEAMNDSELCSRLLNNEFAEWASGLKDWIRFSDGIIHAWPLYVMPIESLSWTSTSGVTLIGDAAHVSTPFVGEGVNCSMHDSLQLAQEFIKSSTALLDEAVARYEKAMFPRATELIKRSQANRELFFVDDAPERLSKMITGLAAAS